MAVKCGAKSNNHTRTTFETRGVDDVMKWNAASLVEHRLFDRRLVKDDLLDKWHHHADIAHGQRSDYRQFLESYVYKSIS